jgi:acyl-CoA synthetase (AMP-forming)/AMP-acid ligase II
MPIEGVEVEIEDENSLGIGKLIIRSERLYDGYLGKKSHNCDTYVTGDLAKINQNGEVLLYGRADDAINLSSTELVYPFDIEEILISSPLVFDAKVIKHEQSWKAIIVSNTDKSELFEHFNDQFLSKYIPQNFTVVDSIKQNPLGKVLKVFLEEK